MSNIDSSLLTNMLLHNEYGRTRGTPYFERLLGYVDELESVEYQAHSKKGEESAAPVKEKEEEKVAVNTEEDGLLSGENPEEDIVCEQIYAGESKDGYKYDPTRPQGKFG